MLHVILSRGQSNHPVKRGLEDQLIERLSQLGGVRVVITPNLYDLPLHSEGMDVLRGLSGDLVVLSWNYGRARWTLDRSGIRGDEGDVQLLAADELLEEDEDDWEDDLTEEQEKQRVAAARPAAGRRIYCLSLNAAAEPQPFLDEVRRIVQASSANLMQWLNGQATTAQLDRYLSEPAAAPLTIESPADRRWYPVIDFSRCTNCMECIDFCLFGVYGVDQAETILVEQPDNCRKGCPACSRVCPENAIIFPQHKSPAIAGSPAATGGLKIDLSELFGGGGGGDSLELAAKERDEQLLLAGREAVGLSVGIPKRQADAPPSSPDDLDELLDQLDQLDV